MRDLACAAILLTFSLTSVRGQVLIHGAGATFPYPIYSKWFDEFARSHPGSRINYQPIGSGGGLRQLETGVVDFGASDCPVRDSKGLLQFPTVLGAVATIYNVPGVSDSLRFTPRALAGIFLGTVHRWNDSVLAQANPGAVLPDAEIVPVHRADGSGTTYIWSEYLAKTAPAWKQKVGVGMSLNWPAGLGAKGSEGVAGLVQQTPYSIGYVELTYALQNRIAYGRVQNAAGRFVKPDARSIAAAADAPIVPADDLRMSVTDSKNPGAYPICSFTWLLTPAQASDARKRSVIAEFLRWALTKGQRMVETPGYAPLPSSIAELALNSVDRIQ